MSTPKVPEFVYANNGAKYHPCLYCCRAFAHKRYLSLHMKACVRTHVHDEGDRKSNVTLFPNSYMKREEDTAASMSGINIDLPEEEVKMQRRSKHLRHQLKAMDSDLKDTIQEGNDRISGPSEKKIKLNNDMSDGPVNISREDGGNKVARKDVRKFSMENACKLCDEIFSSLDELIMHAKIEHNQRTKDNKKFSADDIEYFLKVFTKMNKSHCPICRKAILNTLNWRGHLYTHCTERKFVCKICGKWFTRGDHCKQHESRHKHDTQLTETVEANTE